MRTPSAGVVLPFVIFWSTLDRSLILPLIPAIADDVQVAVGIAAAAITAHAVAYALFQILWGPLSTRWGRIRVLTLSTAIAAAANLASAIAPDIGWLIAARIASGGAFAATFAAVLTYVGDMLPFARRPAAMSNLATATALGLSLGTIVAGAAITWTSWRWVFAVFAVGTALLVPFIARLPDAVGDGPPVLTQAARLLRNGWALAVCALIALEGALLIGLFNLLPAALQQTGEQAWVSGLVTGAFGVSVIVVSQLMKLVVGRVRAWVFLAFGGACATAGLTVVALQVTASGVLAGAILMGAAWATAHTTMQTWMTDAASPTRALGMTLFSISLMLGGALGAASGAVAIDRDATPLLFAIGTAGAVLFGLLAAVGRARYRVREG